MTVGSSSAVAADTAASATSDMRIAVVAEEVFSKARPRLAGDTLYFVASSHKDKCKSLMSTP